MTSFALRAAVAAALIIPAMPALAADPAPAAAPPAAAPAAAPKFSVDTPIELIVADAAARAVLDAALPGVSNHPAYEQFKSMSLKQVQPYSNGMITDALLTKTNEALAAIK